MVGRFALGVSAAMMGGWLHTGCGRSSPDEDASLRSVNRAPRVESPTAVAPAPILPARPPAPTALDVEIALPPLSFSAYPPPKLRPPKVVRAPRDQRRLVLSWPKVRGAAAYDLQVASDTDFSQAVTAVKTRRPGWPRMVVAPGLYYARVRATGPKGLGEFSPILLIDTLEPTARVTPRRGVPPAQEPAGRFLWRAPIEGAVFAGPSILLRGEATVPATIHLGNLPALEARGRFSHPFTLRPGQNVLKLIVTEGRRVEALERRVFFAPPGSRETAGDSFGLVWRDLLKQQALIAQLDTTRQSLEERYAASDREPEKEQLRAIIRTLAQDRAHLHALAEADRNRLHQMLQ